METNCEIIDENDVRLISNLNSQFNPNRVVKLVRSNSSLSVLELIQLTAFDFEVDHEYEFWLVAKCNSSLMSTRVRLVVLDKNDHLPRFVQPVRELNQTFDFTLSLAKLDDYALVQLKAVDLDASDKHSHVKYSIVDTRLEVVSSSSLLWCADLVNLTIYLDEMSGWLYVGRSGQINTDGRSGHHHRAGGRRRFCEVEFRLRAVAINYLADENEISELVEFGLRLRIMSPVSSETSSASSLFTWIIREEFDWQRNTQPVAVYSDYSNSGGDSFEIDRCWWLDSTEHTSRRHPLSQNEFYLNLRWPELYLYAKTTFDDTSGMTSISNVTRIECRLIESKSLMARTTSNSHMKRITNNNGVAGAFAWLVLDMRPIYELPESLEQSVVYVEVERSRLNLDSSCHLTTLDHLSLIEPNLHELMLVYKLADSNENFIQKVS